MYVRGLAINGLADLPRFSASELGRQVTVRGPNPAASAIGDGLSLGFAALSAPVLQKLLVRWGLVSTEDEAEIECDPFPTQATWSDTTAAQQLCADRQQRKISVRMELELDPPLCADLRAWAVREPRVSIGIGDTSTPRLSIEVSAFFGASWDVLSLSVQSVILGSERFPSATNERAKWLSRLLHEIGRRFVSHDENNQHADQAMQAMTSRSAKGYERFESWQQSLQDEMGCVRPVPTTTGAAVLLADNRPINRHGPRAVRRAQLAATATLSGADIMWMGDDDEWAHRFVEGDGTALEQMWSVSPQGTLDPTAQRQPRTVLSFGQAEE